jgi:hypothetical protein
VIEPFVRMVEAIGTVDTTGVHRETRLFAGEPFLF